MYIVAITGASGSILGIRLIEELLNFGKKVGVIISDSGWQIIKHEILQNKQNCVNFRELLKLRNFNFEESLLFEFSNNDFFTPPASGTGNWKTIIVVPTSMKTLSAVANGYTDSLITRAVDVAIKEGKQTILVPRETPLSEIHLENMIKIKKTGAFIVPPVMAFYTFPKSIDDMIDFVVGKLLNLLSIKHNLFENWSDDI